MPFSEAGGLHDIVFSKTPSDEDQYTEVHCKITSTSLHINLKQNYFNV